LVKKLLLLNICGSDLGQPSLKNSDWVAELNSSFLAPYLSAGILLVLLFIGLSFVLLLQLVLNILNFFFKFYLLSLMLGFQGQDLIVGLLGTLLRFLILFVVSFSLLLALLDLFIGPLDFSLRPQ